MTIDRHGQSWLAQVEVHVTRGYITPKQLQATESDRKRFYFNISRDEGSWGVFAFLLPAGSSRRNEDRSATITQHLPPPTFFTMVKFSAVAVAAVTLSSVSAFAPVPTGPRISPALSAATLDAPPPLSPLTSWGDKLSDIRKVQQEYKQQPLPEFAPTVSAKELGLTTVEEQLQYVKDNAFDLKLKMEEGGAVIFRDWDLMKSQDGFQDFYKALGMHVCLDPLHSVSARPTVDGQKNSPVYEAVNKESRKNFFIGTYH